MEGRFKEITGINIKAFGWRVLSGDLYSISPLYKTIIISQDYDDHMKDFYSSINYAGMAYLCYLGNNKDTKIEELFSAMYPKSKFDYDVIDNYMVVKRNNEYKKYDVIQINKDKDEQYKFTNISYHSEANEICAKSKFLLKDCIKYIVLPGSQDVTVDDVGVIMIPEDLSDSNSIVKTYIKSNNIQLMEIDICVVKYSQKTDEIIKECLHRVITLIDGKTYIEREEIIHYPWMNHIHTSLDFVKNPLNKEAWIVLSDEPAYQGADLFVTSDERPYIHMNGAWIPASREWIKKHPNLPESIAYEYELYKGVKGST
jgi:hypothetical protein